MIAVVTDDPAELIHVLGGAVEVAVLVHDEHPEAVTGIEEFGTGRIMRTAMGIGSHLLEFPDPKIPEGVGDGRPHPGVVDVVAGSLDLERLVVEEESLLRIEADRPEADLCRDEVV